MMLDMLAGLRRTFVWCCMVLPCLACEASHAATLKGVRFGQQGGASRLVIDLDEEVAYVNQPSDDPAYSAYPSPVSRCRPKARAFVHATPSFRRCVSSPPPPTRRRRSF